jgi:hypothetical protein
MMRFASKQLSLRRTIRPPRILFALLLMLFFAPAARAEPWYLMAADEKLMTEPEIAGRLSQGSKVGPIHFTSRAKFSSREKCEAARPGLVDDWRRRNIIRQGSWNRHGFSTPNSFILCTSGADPRLAKSPVSAEAGLSMDISLNVPGRARGTMN